MQGNVQNKNPALAGLLFSGAVVGFMVSWSGRLFGFSRNWNAVLGILD
jgi:hypothetical protein